VKRSHRTPEGFDLNPERVMPYRGRVDDPFGFGAHRPTLTRRDQGTAQIAAFETEREFRASFERQRRASRGWDDRAGMAGAPIRRAQCATISRGVDPCSGMWRDRVFPASYGAQTRRVKTTVVGWATAESPAAGCGAVHDRMTSKSASGGGPEKPVVNAERGRLGCRDGTKEDHKPQYGPDPRRAD